VKPSRLLLTTFGLALLAGASLAPQPSRAQTPTDEVLRAMDCGTWQYDVWSPGFPCQAGDDASLVSGTLTAVNGHLLTLQRPTDVITIDDRIALERRATGRVADGLETTARGYWQGNTFYATALH
jgi:hypothetical protein